jgi:hypothetical protein
MVKEFVKMARRKYSSSRATKSKGKTTYGKPFRKNSNGGKFRKGTMIRYKYVNGRRVGAEKFRK